MRIAWLFGIVPPREGHPLKLLREIREAGAKSVAM